MKMPDILNSRLFNQHISHSDFSEPGQVVRSLCGIQAQDFPNAKWGMGIRIPVLTDASIEKAISEYSLIRTWLFRGTLHFVSADDIQWLLGFLSKRLIQAGMPRKRQLGLNEQVLQNSQKLIYKMLKDGKAHTRNSIKEFLNLNGIKTPDNILAHILQYSALNGLICFGPKKENEFTFVLLDAIPTKQRNKTRDEALHDLAYRYFNSHGPATIKDFIWWSGLTIKDARNAIELTKDSLISESFEENEFWMTQSNHKPAAKNKIYLLPAFDSYLLAYRDRSFLLDDLNFSRVVSSNGIFRPIIVQEGKIVGIWRRTIQKDKLILETSLFKPHSMSLNDEITSSANHMAKFLMKELSRIIYE